MTDIINELFTKHTGDAADDRPGESPLNPIIAKAAGAAVESLVGGLLRAKPKPRRAASDHGRAAPTPGAGDQAEATAAAPHDSSAASDEDWPSSPESSALGWVCSHILMTIETGTFKGAPLPMMLDDQGQETVSWRQCRAQFISEAAFLRPVLNAAYRLTGKPLAVASRVIVLALHALGSEDYAAAFGEELDADSFRAASQLMLGTRGPR